jgi:hypothetical protein
MPHAHGLDLPTKRTFKAPFVAREDHRSRASTQCEITALQFHARQRRRVHRNPTRVS